MVKKRAARGSRGPSRRERETPGEAGGLWYKVVELSTVDERTLEQAVNHWSARGWRLDGVQFAMRESSKRPSMAFVFFTRPAEAGAVRRLESLELEAPHTERPTSGGTEPRAQRARVGDAWRRLEALAQGGEDAD